MSSLITLRILNPYDKAYCKINKYLDMYNECHLSQSCKLKIFGAQPVVLPFISDDSGPAGLQGISKNGLFCR